MSTCGLTRMLTESSNPGMHVRQHCAHTPLPQPCVMAWAETHGMCMHACRRLGMRVRRVNDVYLWLARCTHRSPVQDHGHLSGLVDVAAERSAGPGASVAVGLAAPAPTPQACRHKDGDFAHCLPSKFGSSLSFRNKSLDCMLPEERHELKLHL